VQVLGLGMRFTNMFLPSIMQSSAYWLHVIVTLQATDE